MSIYQDIQREQLRLRKNREREDAARLTTVIGELQTQEKRGEELTDLKVIRFLKKTIANMEDNISLYNQEQREEIYKEIALLERFLPHQMNALEIEKALVDADFNDIGGGMRFLSENYEGKYDGKTAKNVVLRILDSRK